MTEPEGAAGTEPEGAAGTEPEGAAGTEPEGAAGTGRAGAGGGRPTVVVVGGGIAGLAAAWQLSRSEARPRVVLFEASERLGGKIDTGELAGATVEWGPDAFLARVPFAVELCRELGLGTELVSPAEGGAYLWSRGRLRRLPVGLVLGVPTDLVAVARSGTVGPLGVARAALDLVRPGPPATVDRSVGDLVTARLGPEVQARLVDPLVGGINAGRSELLSLAATTPQLAAAARAGGSLMRALRAQAAAAQAAAAQAAAAQAVGAGGGPAPVFLSHPLGLGHVVATLSDQLGASGVEIRTRATVTSLERTGATPPWVVTAGDDRWSADAVVVATPAPATASLLSPVCPAAAATLAGIEHSSVVVTTFAYPAGAVSRPLDGSGFLVPRPEGRLMTAATWMSAKWAHVKAPGALIIRASAGRHRDERAMEMDDDALASTLHSELSEAMGLSGRPLQVRVTRWVEAFPQYAVGHLDRVASLEDAVAALPGLAVAGAAYRGVGIPACINSGRQAADLVLTGLQAAAGSS